MQPDAPLQAGVTLSIPKSTLSANSASTFKPYDPSSVIGDANPALSALPVPQADDGCGGFGQILTLIVVVAVIVITQQYELAGEGLAIVGEAEAAQAGYTTAQLAQIGASSSGASFSAGAIAGAAGSVAGQLVGNALGIQDGFSWQAVALGALSGGIGGALSGVDFTGGAISGLGNTIVRAAVGSALTQGIGVATGLQRSFSWTNVAASAIGAGVGYGANEALGLTRDGIATNAFSGADKFGRATLGSLAASTATALAHGGRVSITQIGVNAFGQSIGSSLAEQAMMGGTQEDRLGGFIEQNQPAWEQRQAYNDQIVGAFNQDYSGNRYPGVQMADASGRLTLSNARSSDEAYFGNIIDTQHARDRNIARMMELANEPQAMGYATSAAARGRGADSVGNVDMSPTIANTARLGLMGPDGQTEGTWASPVSMINPVGVPLPPFGSGAASVSWRTNDQAYYSSLISNAGNPITAIAGTFGRAFNNAGHDLVDLGTGLYSLATDSNARTAAFTALSNINLNPLDLAASAFIAGVNYGQNTSLSQTAEDVVRYGAGGLAMTGALKFATNVGEAALSGELSGPLEGSRQAQLGGINLRAYDADTRARILERFRAGNEFETQARAAMDVSKNYDRIYGSGELGGKYAVPDSMRAGIVEFKDVRELSRDLQFQLYGQSQKRIDLVVSPRNEYISGPLVETIRDSGGSISIFNPRSGLFHPYDFDSGMFLITRPK